MRILGISAFLTAISLASSSGTAVPQELATSGTAQSEVRTIHATLSTAPEIPKAGEVTTLNLALVDGVGDPVEDLLSHHGRKLHVVLVSEDMQVFGHIHPQDFGKDVGADTASVQFAFPQPGRYLAAADAMTGTGPYAAHFELTVAGGAPRPRTPAVPAPARLVVVGADEGDIHKDPVLFQTPGPTGGYEVSVSRPAVIKTGEPATFTWRTTKDGEPVTDLRLFLQAAMHLAIVSDDLGHFLHSHGLATGINTGYDHSHGPGGVESGASGAPDLKYFGPEIIATITFPGPGRYYLFGQSAHGEALLISRVSVDVSG